MRRREKSRDKGRGRPPWVRSEILRSRNSGGTYTKRKHPSLAKEGWPRRQEKWPEGTVFGADGGGSFKLPLESIRRLNKPPRLRPAKVASRHFVDGRSHPSFAKLSVSHNFLLDTGGK